MLSTNIAHAARDHDRFVIAPNLGVGKARQMGLVSTKVSGQVRSPEFIIERCATNRSLDHDIERRSEVVRVGEIVLPRLLEAGNAKVRYRETGQTRFRLVAEPGCAFIADLPARSCRRARER